MNVVNKAFSPPDWAQARGYLYHLLGTLFLQGVHEGNIEHLRMIPELEGPLHIWEESNPTPETMLFDKADADHQHLFGFNIFPYQSMFLSEEGQIGGDETQRVVEHYTAAGFPIVTSAENPDHIGVELFFLAFLSQKESQALHADAQDLYEESRLQQRRFLDQNFFLWLPLFVQAVRLTNHPVFVALAEMVLTLSVEHRRELEDLPEEEPISWEERLPALHQGVSFLDEEKTGLREIATFLLSPVSSGFYLSRDDIRLLSRKRRVPAGFGPRRLMLTNLFRSAADYEELPDIVGALQEYLEIWQNMVASLSQYELPVLAQISSLWTQRLEATSTWLKRIEHESLLLSAEEKESL